MRTGGAQYDQLLITGGVKKLKPGGDCESENPIADPGPLSATRPSSLWARTLARSWSPLRLAVFGAGGMGATHASAYVAFGSKERLEIAGVVSRSAAKARRLAKRVNAPWFTDPQKVLRDESIDAIDVTVPSGLHRPLVVSALSQGKHVFCETPVALTLRDADAMIEVEYRGGSAFIEGSAMMPPGCPFTTALRVQCDAGTFDHVTEFRGGPIPKTRSVRTTERGLENVPVRGPDPYTEECRHFVRAVHRKADAKLLSPDAERDALRIALAARAGIRKGRVVDLPQ